MDTFPFLSSAFGWRYLLSTVVAYFQKQGVSKKDASKFFASDRNADGELDLFEFGLGCHSMGLF